MDTENAQHEPRSHRREHVMMMFQTILRPPWLMSMNFRSDLRLATGR